VGIFVSGFCKDQIVAFVASMMACFGIFLAGTDFIVVSVDGWVSGLGTFIKNAFGASQHFNAFQKGVIDSRDFLYFIIGTIIFLTLNAFWLEIKLKPKAKTVFSGTCLLCVVIVALFNSIFVDITIGRFDCTQGKIYTLSEAGREILSGLKAPVTVKFFVSPPDKMPSAFKTLEREVRDKLDEFVVASRGKFNYKVFHMEAAGPAQGSEATLEESIQRKGIEPFQVQSIEADEVGVKLVYSAMSVAYKEKAEEIIPRITPQSLSKLEYIIISTIYKMTLDSPLQVALVAPYEEKALDPQIKELLKSLGQSVMERYRRDEYELVPRLLEYEGYKTKRIQLTQDEPIPEDTDILIILEPSRLNQRQRFEINKFLVNGGSVFLAVQRYNFEYSARGPQGVSVRARDTAPEINQLLQQWGLSVNRDLLMDVQADVVTLTGARVFGIFEVSSPVKLPMQLRIIPEQMNQEISITSNLGHLLYLWGSALTVDDDKIKQLGLQARTLFYSSPEAWQAKYHSGYLNNSDLSPPGSDERKQYPLAVLVKGQFPDAFKGKSLPAWPKREEIDESSSRTSEKRQELNPKPGQLILVGCARMFDRNLLSRAGHAQFFMNSIEAISLGEKLIEVRSKQPMFRPLKRVSSATKIIWKAVVTFLVPLAICFTGGLRLFMRRRQKWLYLKTV